MPTTETLLPGLIALGAAAALGDERITGKVLAGIVLVVVGVAVVSGSAG